MNRERQEAREQMRQDIYATIRRNLVRRDATLSRHEVVEILANVLAGQIGLIRDDARNQRTQ
jgi:hypothetical protein